MSEETILIEEFTNDPLARGYTLSRSAPSALTDLQIRDSLIVIDRDAEASKGAILQYMLMERFRTNSGADLTQMFLYGRLGLVVVAAVGTDVFGSTTNSLTLDQKGSAITFTRMLGPDSEFILDLLDSRFDSLLNDIRNAEIFGPPDKTAIQALSQNQQSRARELGLNVSNKRLLDLINHVRTA